jgi:hypothetical protein
LACTKLSEPLNETDPAVLIEGYPNRKRDLSKQQGISGTSSNEENCMYGRPKSSSFFYHSDVKATLKVLTEFRH